MTFNQDTPEYEATQATQRRWRGERVADSILAADPTTAEFLRKYMYLRGATVAASVAAMCGMLVSEHFTK